METQAFLVRYFAKIAIKYIKIIPQFNKSAGIKQSQPNLSNLC